MNSERIGWSAEELRPRLLILDDEDAILIPLARYFRTIGYDVATAREAEEAEAMLSCDSYELVILDLSLSRFGPDGLEVLRSIRARSGELPVVVLSANIRPEVEREARQLGVSVILVKPQPLEALARVVASTLAKV